MIGACLTSISSECTSFHHSDYLIRKFALLLAGIQSGLTNIFDDDFYGNKVFNMKRFLSALTLFASCLCLTTFAVAQTDSNSSKLTMNQWVHLSQDGALTGRVLLANAKGQASTLDGVNVSIRDRDGASHQGQTDASGKFRFPDLKPGIYSLAARGSNTFASIALHVLPYRSGTSDGFPTVAEVSVARLQNETVQMAIARYLPPKVEKDNTSIDTSMLSELASQVYGSELSQVVQVNGGMKGQIFRAGSKGAQLQSAKKTNVFLFQKGVEVARSLTDEFGHFEIDKLAVGHYSMLAIGRDGIGSIGFVLVDEAQAKETARKVGPGKDAETLVMQNSCCGVQQEFAMQIAPMPDIVQIVQTDACGCGNPCGGCSVPVPACGCGEIVEGGIVDGEVVDGAPVEEVAEEGIASGGYAGYRGGGFGGGFGGGGGGGGGGFGLGGLGALGGLGGVLAAAGNNGGGTIVAPIVPPSRASASVPTN